MRPQLHYTAPLASLQRWGLLVGVVAGLLMAIGGWFDPAGFFPAYLVALLFWNGIALGCLGIALIHHLTGGAWGVAIRRILEAGYGTLPLMALAFVPLLFGMETLYQWARPEEVAADPVLTGKARYLNVVAFQIRALVYFAIWIVLGFLINRLSAGRDPAKERLRRRRLALLSGPGLILWCLTTTFAAVDWSMSLEPHWFSSMYGVLFMGGQGVSGLSFAIIALLAMRHWQPWNAVLTAPRLHDLGNLLLAFVLFWSYVSFMQFLIIWSGNLPEETPWYLHRIAFGWQAVAIALVVLHFLVPFLLLLGRENKRRPQRLWPIAALLLLMRLTDLFWTVKPTFSPEGFSMHWLLPLSLAALGGLWLALFAWRLAARADLPVFELSEAEEALDDVAPAHH